MERRSPERPPAHETGPYLEPLRLLVRGVLAPLPWWLSEFILFGLKQAWACLFAAIMLTLLLVTKFVWQPDWALYRYDFLFIAALAIQFLFLRFRMESWDEAKVILVYHVTGTVMEIFKVHMGSWAYPEPAIIQIAGVPLFSGFMYASVGSFMARTIRIFDMRFTRYPPMWLTGLLAIAIYVNFFSHHYLPDLRYLLFAATVVVFRRVDIHFTTDRTTLRMPLVVAAFLSSAFLWVAENIGTLTGTWIYPTQKTWHVVSFGKLGSWYLLLYVSFVLVTLVLKPRSPILVGTSANQPAIIR
ncbi:DUF817 domain-containing protein [Neorhizobium petrolearium]|uniref:DUF817 domain-containing protein n=1 Tax=Neorhizobium petrolearium TaxID=515361 RepID=A0ABY8M493_9HYPH|nr:DUF817 domain-containing protein [Neorhizobium petrolearium]MCC2613179.1 DUF817 domain-containing protein [Neorhizobium petrolearium]WGI68270.1 DUF817 domain-containing protein [Neorhizobium petrolearium]